MRTVVSTRRERREGARPSGGFTLVELMVALTVLLIGITGLLAMQLTALKASGYSRHATEASVLAEDRMESLRTMPAGAMVSRLPPGEIINAQGILDATGPFERTWVIANNPDGTYLVTVTVQWRESGTTPSAITLQGLRR